jgi:hypothetical protein
MKRIIPIAAIVLIAGLSVLWFLHRAKQRALDSGDVYVRDQSANPTGNAAPANPATNPGPVPQETATNTAPSAPGGATLMTQPQGAIAVPVSDTIPRNPPGGMAFAGSGKYQLYRQGDITWRLNTDTGQACIIFATDTQWSKPRVYSHGCGAG